MPAAETPGGALTRTSSDGTSGTALRSPLRAGRLPAATGDLQVSPQAALHVTSPTSLPTSPARPPAAADRPRLQERHVLLVGRDYSPAGAPEAPYTTAIADHLARLAAEVTVLAGLPEGADGRVASAYRRGLRFAEPGWRSPEAPHVLRLRHASTRGAGPLRRVWHELSFAAAVVLAGRHLHPDLVVAVTPSPGGAAAAARLAARRGIPLVTLVQGTTPATDPRAHRRTPGRLPRRMTDRLAALVTARLERSALRGSAEVVVASEAFRPAALASGVDPACLHLLPHWTPELLPLTSRLAARAALGWSPDRFTVVHAGPMGHRQDLAVVVEAARQLAARLDDLGGRARHQVGHSPRDRGLAEWDQAVRAGVVDVVLAGDGSQRAALQQQAFGLDNVRFVDVPDAATQALVLTAADVLLVADPGSAGAAGAADPGQLPAYLAAGRPVLAQVPASSAVACELRRAGEAGRRVDPGDPAALADALVAMQGAPRQRALMSRTARRYARAHLGREAALRRLELVVDAALTRRSQEGAR